MEISSLIESPVGAHQVGNRASTMANSAAISHAKSSHNHAGSHSGSNASTAAPNLPPKSVRFEYIMSDANSSQKARLPMRVNIYTHDDTDSIIATVKNFYGLYDGNGVSFEDASGNTLIARYENFEDKMTVYVRVVDGVNSKAATPSVGNSPRRPRLQAAFEPQPLNSTSLSFSRSPSRTGRAKRSASPQNMPGHRSQSVSTVKSRQKKTRVGSIQDDAEFDSDSDGGNASVTSSRRGKIDVVASAEISVENIVEGGRRKRARFDSSELPLFVPSQVPFPGSVSSVSPQRRAGPGAAMSPFQPNQHTFSYSMAPSPQSFGHTDSGYRTAGTFSASGSSYARGMHNSGYSSHRHSISGPGGILPTPDPTIGSVISDEDVALQLMRLGDASNFSNHGRTSTSTMDDGFSGKADASSGDETDYGSGGEDLPAYRARHSDYSEGEDDASFKGESDGIRPEEIYRKAKKERIQNNNHKSSKVRKWKVNKTNTAAHKHVAQPQQPDFDPITGAPNLNFQHFQQPLAEDEEDLSSKPRCQRCRKSKKGCDRQRPCGRCKDAGIGIDGCVSEDEGNGRKGRFGRHMGVPIKKGDEAHTSIEEGEQMFVMASMAPPPFVGDKSKKRKR